jgi:uncharacterized coiled-coil protein SlyX
MKTTQQDSVKQRLTTLEQTLTNTQVQIYEVTERVVELKLLLENFGMKMNTKLDQLEQILTRRN